MGRMARLTHASSAVAQEFIGMLGELNRNENGGYSFYMPENGKTISTSAAKSNTTLGDVENPICRNIGFETKSGSLYQFDFMDVEKLVDGARRVDNQFLGFEEKFKVGDPVVFNDEPGVITCEFNNNMGHYYAVSFSGRVGYCYPQDLKPGGSALDSRLQEAYDTARRCNLYYEKSENRTVEKESKTVKNEREF